MSHREVMQQALEALNLSAVTVDSFGVQQATQDAITALRTALEQQQAEPVAYTHKETRLLRRETGRPKGADWDADHWEPLYTTPPQRQWVGLTDEDFLEACQIAERGNYLLALQRIQIKLKERNHG